MAKTKKDSLSIDEAFEMIEEKIERMKKDDISLEDAYAEFTEGLKLVNYCKASIEKVEKSVQMLTEDGEEVDFDGESEED